jgi:hypothetical protein
MGKYSESCWVYLALPKVVVLWHCVQSVEKPAAACGGFVVASHCAWWQAMQAVGGTALVV